MLKVAIFMARDGSLACGIGRSFGAPHIAAMPAAVRDNPALSRFELDVNGVTAVANHQRDGGVMTFTHTEVPPRARHGGIASQPIAGALQSVRARGLKNRAALLVRESLRR